MTGFQRIDWLVFLKGESAPQIGKQHIHTKIYTPTYRHTYMHTDNRHKYRHACMHACGVPLSAPVSFHRLLQRSGAPRTDRRKHPPSLLGSIRPFFLRSESDFSTPTNDQQPFPSGRQPYTIRDCCNFRRWGSVDVDPRVCGNFFLHVWGCWITMGLRAV